jgi:superfamily II DNA or RNA helicase
VYVLRPYQIACMNAIDDQFAHHRSTLVEMATGLGKAQPLSAMVLTPSGFVPMGSLQPWDYAVGSDGQPVRIRGIFPQGRLEVCRVKFSDGTTTRCCYEHLWNVQTKSQKHRTGQFETRRLFDLIGDLQDSSGAAKWFVPTTAPVEFSVRPVAIEPYAFGILLGDGGLKYGLKLTSVDQFILQEAGKRLGVELRHDGDCDYLLKTGVLGCKGSPLHRALKGMGLRRKGSAEKFIPEDYRYNTVECRLAVLRGLMDTDGHVRNADGHAEFDSTSWRLATDVCEIVRSLGGCTRVRTKSPGKYTHKGEKRIAKGPSYRVTVSLDGINPFLMPRKADNYPMLRNQGQTKAIVSIEPDGEEECQCISVESENGLYLTDDYIVTHNTVIFAHVADVWPGRVLVIAHRDELIRQAAEKIQQVTGKQVAIEMGRERADESLYGTKVTVASIQTLARAKRRHRFHPDHFSLVVIDEGHHAAAVTYREVLDYFTSAKRLFVTATPKRGDDVALECVCETVAFQYGIEPAIDDGWLVPVKQIVVKVEGLDFSKARTVADDFNQGDLERILTEEKPLHAMVGSAFELIGPKQALWFCNSVLHAKATAGVLARYAPADAVKFLSGDTPKEERRYFVDQYKKGRVQHLLNCALFLEGFDAPSTSAIVMGRPTKSLSLYMQVLGRGTRPLPGVVDGIDGAEQRRTAIAMSDKPCMTVIDFAGNAGRHKIIQAADVLGGKHEAPVRDYAKETMAEEGCAVDLEEALARAKAEMDLEAEENARRKKITAKVQYQTQDVDPFVRQYTPKPNGVQVPKSPGDPCSSKQAGYICYLSRKAGADWTYAKASQLTKQQARGVIGKLQAMGGR